jgi:dTDP-glucose 4,6-dehydratase
VENTVEGFLLAATKQEAIGKTINFGSGREISVKDLADLIFKLTGKIVPIESAQERIRPEGSEVDRLLADNSLAKSLLGWEPTIGLEAGLEMTLEWMKNNLEKYRPADYVL